MILLQFFPPVVAVTAAVFLSRLTLAFEREFRFFGGEGRVLIEITLHRFHKLGVLLRKKFSTSFWCFVNGPTVFFEVANSTDLCRHRILHFAVGCYWCISVVSHVNANSQKHTYQVPTSSIKKRYCDGYELLQSCRYFYLARLSHFGRSVLVSECLIICSP